MTNATEVAKGPQPTQECLDSVIPIKESMAGYNAFYHHCDIYHGRSSYAVCQHTIDAVVENRVQLRSECPDAIKCGSCPALAMRAKEREAQRALFFTDRRPRLAQLAAEVAAPCETIRYGKQGMSSAGLKTSHASTEDLQKFDKHLKGMNQTAPAPKEKGEPKIAGNSQDLLGEAINNMMKETKKDG